MIKKLIIGLLIGLLLISVGCELRSLDSEITSKCRDYCISKNMSQYQFTGKDKEYVRCVCDKIFLINDFNK